MRHFRNAVVTLLLVAALAVGVAWSAQPVYEFNWTEWSSPKVHVHRDGLAVGNTALFEVKSGAYENREGFSQHEEFIAPYTAFSGLSVSTDGKTETWATTSQIYPGWVKRLRTSGTNAAVYMVTSGTNGVAALSVSATAEPQDAVLSNNDQLVYDVSTGRGGVVFETMIQANTLPTKHTHMAIGLAGAVAFGPVGQFVTSGRGYAGVLTQPTNPAIIWDVWSGTATTPQVMIYVVASGCGYYAPIETDLTLGTGDWARLRIDASDPKDVKFSYNKNGKQWIPVATASGIDIRAIGHNLQPYFSVSKSTAFVGEVSETAGVGKLYVDYVDLQVIGRR